jgi:TRAP-type C4-dicarboxylate transport system substrate-binding protein
MNKLRNLVVVLGVCTVAFGQTENKEIIKLGTLATEASDWGQILKEMGAELVHKSNGKLEIRFFFGRDEQDLVKLLKNRQCDAVSLTAAGLGQILPSISVFQLPMLFSAYEEWDHVKNHMTDDFVGRFARAGCTFLGWADIGFVYLFSKEAIRTQTDLQKSGLWAWTLDPIAQAFASAAGSEPVLLPIESVLSSLRNDEIQTVYASPLACIVYQWQTQVKYLTNLPLSVGIGATIMDNTRFNEMDPGLRNLLRKTAKEFHIRLVKRIRESNEESLQVLQRQGLQIIDVPQMEKRKWSQVLGKVQNRFVGQLYEQELLDEVRDLLRQYQARK